MKKWIAGAVALMAVSTAALADDRDNDRGVHNNVYYGPEQGNLEFTLSGVGSNDKHFSHGSAGISFSMGLYLTRGWEIALRQGVNYAGVSGTSSWSGSTRVAIDYNIDFDRFRPFIGIEGGGIYGDNVHDTGIGGAEIGLKYYIKPTAFVYLQTEYQYLFDTSSGVTSNSSNGAYAHSIGIGLLF